MYYVYYYNLYVYVRIIKYTLYKSSLILAHIFGYEIK